MEPTSFPPSYYENFLESLARITSKLLTDRETETVLHSIRSFQEKLNRMSSQSLTRLQQEAPSPVKKVICQHDGKTCTQNCTRGFIKAFTVGYGVKYLIAILPALLMGKVFKRPSLLRRAVNRDTAMFALFLSTFLSSYKGILCLLRRYNSSERQNAFIAGSIAGISLMIDRDTRRRQSIMIYLFARSFQFIGAWMMKQWGIRRQVKHAKSREEQRDQIDLNRDESTSSSKEIKDEKDWEDKLAGFLQRWAGILVMIVANSELVYAMIFHQETISKSFLSFLLTHGDWKPDVGSKLAPSLMQAIGDTIRSMSASKGSIRMPLDTTSREFVATHISSVVATAIPPGIRHKYIVCALQHPLDPGCAHSKITLFRHEFVRALKLYVPLNVIMTAVFRSNKLMTQPGNVLQKLAISCLQSTFFLSMFVTAGLASPCVVRPIFNRERLWIYLIPGAIGGLMTALEVKSRQLELGMYCMTRAIESYWNILVKNGYARNVPNGDVLAFMFATGTLMTFYHNDKDIINSNYLAIMTRFFGKN